MERSWTRARDQDAPSPEKVVEFTLPSRERALQTCLRGLAVGPVLITGEAGSGKTWLAGRVAEEADEPRDWLRIDLTPSLDVHGLYRAIGHRLGLEPSRRDPLALADALADAAAEGRRFGLILDEAHLASDALLEEIRILGNHASDPDRFAALFIVAQTSLLRRLAMRSAVSLASRIGTRVHLRAIDADEAGVLIDHLTPGCALDHASLERCHRDASGNPRLLLMLVRREAETARRPFQRDSGPFNAVAPRLLSRPTIHPDETDAIPLALAGSRVPTPAVARISEDDGVGDPSSTPATSFEPFLVRTPFGLERPPIASEDGMIEVGWEPELAADEADDFPITMETPGGTPESPVLNPGLSSDSRSEPEMERLADHYAALQAWEEWSRNQGRTADERVSMATRSALDVTSFEALSEARDRLELASLSESRTSGDSSGIPRPTVWAEPQHSHAPYGPLFPGARPPADPEH